MAAPTAVLPSSIADGVCTAAADREVGVGVVAKEVGSLAADGVWTALAFLHGLARTEVAASASMKGANVNILAVLERERIDERLVLSERMSE